MDLFIKMGWVWINWIDKGNVERARGYGKEGEYRITVNMSNFQFEDAGSIPATCNKTISITVG